MVFRKLLEDYDDLCRRLYAMRNEKVGQLVEYGREHPALRSAVISGIAGGIVTYKPDSLDYLIYSPIWALAGANIGAHRTRQIEG